MKVALVHPRLDVRGGAENVVLWMARGLAERGHAVRVVAGRFSPERWEPGDWEGVDLAVLGARRREAILPRAARKRAPARRLRPLVAGCDVLVAHNPPAPLWATLARPRGARVVWLCEEPSVRMHWRDTQPTVAALMARADPPAWAGPVLARHRRDVARHERRPARLALDRRIDREAAARVDRIVANSAFTAHNVQRVYGRSAVACPLGVPDPGAEDARRGDPYVAWVTSASLHKNAFGFLEAVRIAVHERGLRDLRVRALGLDAERFGPWLAARGLGVVVRLEPWLSDAEVDRLLAGSRCVAYPALDEPFGLVAVHAMARGRAVLASATGGPSETVVHGVTGLHADPLDPADLARGLVRLWRDPAWCDALGAAGRERYRSHFTLDHFLDRFERIALGASPAPS